MFIGHYGAGFALKKIAPEVSLGTLFLASQWLDLVWPVLVLFGIERVSIAPGTTAVTPLVFEFYPYSHSLVAAAVWAALSGVVYFALKRKAKNAIVLSALVLGHWFLDLIVHAPDLPLGLGDLKFGLGLWDSIIGTIIIEGAIFLAGFLIYLRSTTGVDNTGRYAIWAIAALLAFIYAGQFAGSAPPNSTVVAIAGLAQWIFIISAWWVDRHRPIN